VYVIAYAHHLRISQVRAVCLGLRLLPNLAIDKERTGEMLFTQLCFNKHTIIHITHVATLLLLTRFHFGCLLCLSTIAQSNLFFQIIDLLKEASKPLDRRTLIDLLPSLKYDDLLPPVAALPPVSCLPGRQLSTELPVVALHTR
jgi:hypothetical protein